MFVLFESKRAGLFEAKHWLPNIVSGVIVAMVALPLAMAFAIASGATPESGLYTAIIAALFVGIFGGSRVQIAGPTGAFIVILAGIVARYGFVGLQIASLMAGVILILMGLLKLGNVIKFIPEPVIAGFTAGIGVIIFVGEWKDFFGLKPQAIPLDASFILKIKTLIMAFATFNVPTTMLACLSVFLILLAPKFLKRVPGPLVAMIVVTAMQHFFHFASVATLGSAFGNIPRSLPHFEWPVFSGSFTVLVAPAFTIAFLGAIESLLSASAADGMAGTRHHSNRELIGQGLANIAAPLFGGFAATGAIARTATNIRNGGNSPLAAIVHSIMLMIIILLFSPIIDDVPMCALAAVLFVVSYNMSDFPHFISTLRKAPYYDVVVLLVTFLLTVFVNLVVAVAVGVILAMLLFVRRLHQSIDVHLETNETLQQELKEVGLPKLPENILVYTIDGPFFFGVTEKSERTLAVIHGDPRFVVFRLGLVPFMDVTGLQRFGKILEHYYDRGVPVYLCEASVQLIRILKKFHVLKWVVDEKVLKDFLKILQVL